MAVSTYVGSAFIATSGSFTTDITAYGAGQALPDLSGAAAGTWAIIFWWDTGGTSPGTWGAGPAGTGVGFTTGASNSYCTSMVSVSGQTTTITGRAMKAKAVNFNYTNGSDVVSADFTSMLAGGGFRLTFAGPGNLGTQALNFMLISGLTNAKVVNFTEPGLATTKLVTGVGFSPDLVFLAGDANPTALPASTGEAYFGFGMFNKHGQQVATGMTSQNGVTTSNTARIQQTDACFVLTNDTPSLLTEAHFTQMTADGFDLYFSISSATRQMIGLCLKGVSSRLGAFVKTTATAPVSQTISSRHNFLVRGALFSNVASSPSAPSAHGVWSLSASDTANARAIGLQDKDAVTTTVATAVWYNQKAVIYTNYQASSTFAEADLTSLTQSDFTLNWTLNNTDTPEIIYCLIGDAGNNTTPQSLPGTSANAASTAFSNQKKIYRTSNGVLWTVINYTSAASGEFSYSTDNGQTWTYYGAASIAGWTNGSIAGYVDAGSTERLVATWKQSGTGGGRVDARYYVMVGAFNAGRTTLTWGTAVEVLADPNYNYPDVIATAYSTGGRALLVAQYVVGGSNGAYGHPVTIDSAGVPTVGTQLNIDITNNPSGLSLFPSVAIDDSGNAHVAWSAGGTGTGYGIRYMRLPFASGTWTVGTEVEVMNTSYIFDNTNWYWLVCRWDGTRAVIIGEVWDGSIDRLIIQETTNFTSFTSRVNEALTGGANRTTHGSATIDAGTGDIYILGSNTAATGSIGYRKFTRSTNTLSSHVATETAPHSPTPHYSASYAPGRIHWIYTSGNNSPYAVKYDYLQLYNPQSGLTLPTSGTAANLNAGYTFKWSYYAPDAAAQTGWSFKRIRSDSVAEYWNNANGTWQSTELYNTGATTELTFAGGKWPVGQTYTWTVSVKNATGVSGYPTPFTVTDSNAATGVQVEVGSFTKQSTTGFQDVTIATNLTQAAAGTWAVVFWTTGPDQPAVPSSGTWGTYARTSLGFVANGGGIISQFAVSAASTDNSAASDTARRMAAAAITIVHENTIGQDEATFTSFPSATTMRINWTSQYQARPSPINYMIISGLTGAKVVNWTAPTAAGSKSVTGVGFSPDLVLLATTSDQYTVPESTAHARLAFGTMNKHGQQWANGIASGDALNPSDTARYQQTDACLALPLPAGTAYVQAHFRSMDTDGFTTYFSNVTTGAHNIISLCLKGVSSKIGAFLGKTTTGTQVIDSRHGFTSKGILFTGGRDFPQAAPMSQAIWSLGATDMINERASALTDQDAVSPTNADSVWYTGSSVAFPWSGAPATTGSLGTVTTSNTSSFTINWTASVGLQSEGLYLLLGDAGTSTLPATIPTSNQSAASTGTTYSNQKKIVQLSTGRKVVVIHDADDNAEFRWSDDGQTWTDYVSDIAGWSNGSIASYVDAGGAERLVAVWKQAGTGGGRTSGDMYIMVGTFNAARTTITWGAHTLLFVTAQPIDYPDIVVHAEGSGGRIHLTYSQFSGGTTRTKYDYRSIDASGNITGSESSMTLNTVDSGASTFSFPSIDYNSANKDIFVVWSQGASGANMGIRFRKASYSQGAWTWATEVEVTTSYYIPNSEYWWVCRWDAAASKVRLVGMRYPGDGLNQYESSNFSSFTPLAVTSGGEFLGFGTAVVDQGTSDVYVIGRRSPNFKYRKWTMSSNTWGSEVDLNTEGILGNGYFSGQYSSGRIEWVYTHGNNSPYAVKYDYIDVNAAPTVTLVTPANNFSVNLNTTAQNFAWTVTDSEGDTQAKYVFRRRKPEHSTYEYWDGVSAWTSTLTEVVSTTNNVSITAGTWAGSQSWLWSVGVRDTSAASPIGYSSERTITNSAFTPTVNTYVGSFNPSGSTGNQDITIPVDLTTAASGTWAIKFWSTGSHSASGTWQGNSDIIAMLGFVANGGGTVSQYAVSTASEDAAVASNTARRIAAAAMTFVVASGASTTGEATFVSFPTSTTMRINWSQLAATTRTINYMIITGLNGAKVIQQLMQSTTGAQAFTGVGFSPDLVLTAVGHSPSIPSSSTDIYFGFGAFNKHGQQWANSFSGRDALNPSRTKRGQSTDASIYYLDHSTAGAPMLEAHFSSMDADGFTLYHSTAAAVNGRLVALCLKGVSSKLGAFIHPTTATAKTVDSRHGFTVRGVLSTGIRNAPLAAPTTHSLWHLGASDLTNQRSAALVDQDANSPINADSVWVNDAIVIDGVVNPTAGTGQKATYGSFTTTSFVDTVSVPHDGGNEELYLLLGDPATNTAPATVGTSTNSVATAYSNQKKLVRLSTGRMVSAYGDTTTNAKFKWSDDGQTWTDYAADIAGWSNGSISAYVDAGGIERIVAVWKQTGTGGGRTDGFIYAMASSLNTPLTSLVWGTAVDVGAAASTINYPDIAAHTDGSGGIAHIVFGWQSGASNYTNYSRVRVAGDGIAAVAIGSTSIGGDYAVAQNTFPSIDHNPLTKDIYAAWSAGTTGAGKGIRFKRATYGGGTWTWGSEVAVDENYYWASDMGLTCRWDGSRVVIAGCLYPSPYLIRVWDSTNFTSFTGRASFNPIGPAGGTVLYGSNMSVDNITGDVYIFGSYHSGTAYTGISYYKLARSGTSLTPGTRVDTDPGLMSANGSVSSLYSSSRIEWVYAQGNNSPYSVKYDYIATGAPVVTLTAPDNGARVDLNTNSQNFAWSISDAEGNAQTHYIFRRRRDGHTSYEYWNAAGSAWTTTLTENASATMNVTIGAGKWTAGKNYSWSVGVKDSTGAIGYSTERTITNSAAVVNTYVGSFTKQAALGNQDITIPVDLTAADAGSWAIIFWGNQLNAGVPVSGTWASHIFQSLGFAANGGGSISQYAVGTTSVDNVATSVTSRRMAAACVTVNDSNDAAYAEATFVSFPTSTTMRLNWSLNGGGNRGEVNYMIITGLSGAKAVTWFTSAGATSKSVTEVGFNPDLALHAIAAHGGGVTVPYSAAHVFLGFGVMNKHGQQWSNSVASQDVVSPSNTSRWQQTDACLTSVGYNDTADFQAHFQSMDSDGFTVRFSDNWAAQTTPVISLCLKGASSKLGAFTKTASVTAQTIRSRHGFTPRAALFTGIMNDPAAAPAVYAKWTLGATDLTNSRLAALLDRDNIATTEAKSIWYNNKVIEGGHNGATVYSAAWTSSTNADFSLTWNTSVVNTEEYLYMLLGDAENSTLPATIGTSTASTATAYSNQKKLVRLSTGRMVAVYGDTGSNAKFKYSDDGITWVDMQSDIAGWANGSIASYVDAGGTERLVVAWYQSGTAGGRTNAWIYGRVGTFSSARTAISWGADHIMSTGSASNVNYPDIVTHAEGSGGKVHLVVSNNDGTPSNSASWIQFGVTSAGVFTTASGSYETFLQLSPAFPGYSVNTPTFPSISFNPVTKDLYVAWSAGAAASGKGIRFRKAAYSSGAWAWNAEREIDSTRYVLDTFRFMSCRYDAAYNTVIMGGQLYSGVRDEVIYIRDANDTTTTTVVLEANHDSSIDLIQRPSGSGSMAIDGEGNVYIVGAGGGNATSRAIVYHKWTRTGVGSGVLGPNLITDSANGLLTEPYVNVLFAGGSLRLIYTGGNNSPYAVKYDSIATTTSQTDNRQKKWGMVAM